MAAPPVLRRAPTDSGIIERAVISTIAYGDVFDYPLQALEVHRYLHGVRATADATAAALARCSGPGGALSRREGFYTLRDREHLVDQRRARQANAARLWPAAVRYAHLIATLPFVRMVAVTGSLAWDNVDQSGDIDYLVVTDPGHLWTCRWLVALVARLAHLRGFPLCPNYLLSTRALVLPDCNLYAAYELFRMTPIVGLSMYYRLRGANPWAAGYLPNAIAPPRAPDVPVRPRQEIGNRVMARLKRLAERVLCSGVGAVLERSEMRYRIGKRLRRGVDRVEESYGPDWFK